MTKLSDILIILHPSQFFLFQLLRKDTFIFSLGYQWSFSIIKIYFHINAFLLINNFHRQITIFLFYQSRTYVVTFVMHHCQLLKQSICLFRMSSVDTHGCKFFFLLLLLLFPAFWLSATIKVLSSIALSDHRHSVHHNRQE